MRTDASSFSRGYALLLTLLAGAGALAPATALAQTDTVVERAIAAEAPEPPEVPEPAEFGDDEDRISVLGGNRTIAEGEVVRDVLVIGGNLRVRGQVTGDAVVVGGNLVLYESGRIDGDVVVAGGRFQNRGGEIGGELRTMDRVPGIVGATVEREARSERSRSSAMGRIGRGFAGIVSTLALALVLGGLGAALVFYGHQYLSTVNDTIRASTVRSGAVGLAALFLVIPAFVILIVALAVSIVGIPLLLVAIPLYPVAVAAAMTFGLLACAHAIGERTSEQRTPYNLRHRNSYAYLATGLVILFAPVVAGHLVGMTPFLGWVGGLIKFFAYLAIWATLTVGLGAVILSRAGTRRTFASADPALDPLDESILDDDPFVAGPRV